MSTPDSLEVVVDQPATLGEGPCWHAQEGALYWVDILGKQLCRFCPSSGQDTRWDVGELIGTVAPRQAGGFIVALQTTLADFDPQSGQISPWPDIDPDPRTRFNDGKCDPAGRFFVGSMDLAESQPIGSLYRVDAQRRVEQIIQGVTISNGIGWSPDRSTMYYIDSPTRQVRAFDYDLDTGDLRNGRIAFELHGDEGYPDGMTTDQEGMIWLAHWAGSRVCRWDPSNGKMLQRYDTPAPHTSACCFGGANLDELYITTARKGLTEQELAEYPLSGCLLRLQTDVPGSPTYGFAG